ncbi:MAG: tRNA (adenosine(37)-N6)-threonylcarbamoyltransferase complex transferase subunit TsaD [Thermodesulfobacteriota bacterium]
MLVLGIESSCDDMAAAVVEDGSRVLSSVVSSQDEIHALYGGVVPELASRRHIESVVPVVEESLKRAEVDLDAIDGIAVTQGPGLVGSILVGLSFAKSVSFAASIPFTGVNHITAHPLAAFLTDADPVGDAPGFPLVALVVSGGHTTLILMDDYTSFRVMGQTRDDAAGEAFDKVAKLLGLGYPGGAAIDRLAVDGDPASVAFTRPFIAKGNLDFSFSGIKTAVLHHVRGAGGELAGRVVADVAASFQEAVVDVLVRKAEWALDQASTSTMVLAGGVACNSRLRAKMTDFASGRGVKLFIPPPRYCSDNAAMVAALGYHQLREGNVGDLDMNARPTWEGF